MESESQRSMAHRLQVKWPVVNNTGRFKIRKVDGYTLKKKEPPEGPKGKNWTIKRLKIRYFWTKVAGPLEYLHVSSK